MVLSATAILTGRGLGAKPIFSSLAPDGAALPGPALFSSGFYSAAGPVRFYANVINRQISTRGGAD